MELMQRTKKKEEKKKGRVEGEGREGGACGAIFPVSASLSSRVTRSAGHALCELTMFPFPCPLQNCGRRERTSVD